MFALLFPSWCTDEVAVVTHLAFKEVLSFSCILKHEDFEIKTNWLWKRIPRAILGLEIMYVFFLTPAASERALLGSNVGVCSHCL